MQTPVVTTRFAARTANVYGNRGTSYMQSQNSKETSNKAMVEYQVQS